MADYFVNPSTGSNGAAGTALGTAWATTQYAMDTAIAGDVIHLVNAATETTSTPIDLDINNGSLASPIIVKGVDTGGALLAAGTYYKLQCSGTPASLINWNTTLGGQYIFWEGVDFDGNDVNTSRLLSMEIATDGNSNVFKHCRIQRSGGDGAEVRGIRIAFIGCEIDNNAGRGLAGQSEPASRWADGNVTDCIIHDNGDDGVSTSSEVRTISGNQCYGNGGSGIKIGNYIGVAVTTIRNNTCYNNTVDGIELQTADPILLSVVNNTLVDNGGYGLNLLTTARKMHEIDYNHYSGNTSGAARHNNAAVTEGNINTNGNLGAYNQTGTAAASLFTSVTAGSEDFSPINSSVLDGNGINSTDIGALPAVDAVGGGGGGIVKLAGNGGGLVF